ncbi:MAG: sulfatase-like hydrolase/transferase [Actinomycetota bacterium]
MALRRRRNEVSSAPGAVPEAAEAPRPRPPDGARNVVVVILDSLRHDSWLAAAPANLARLGPVERRWSYASWTAPSHYNLLMGLLPHSSPQRVYASEYYKKDFIRYGERLGVKDMEFKRLLPSLFLPTFLRNELGYRTHAMVSMPVLNRHTVINRDFDTYELMPKHNDMAAMLDQMRFDEERPSFFLLNVGETHYPYALPGEDPNTWPRISGVHGVFKNLDDHPGPEGEPAFFDERALAELRERQIGAVRYLDGVVGRLFDLVPKDTWIIVTSDHGELFGEDGFFGHGPINHDKVFEVPFVEGRVP